MHTRLRVPLRRGLPYNPMDDRLVRQLAGDRWSAAVIAECILRTPSGVRAYLRRNGLRLTEYRNDLKRARASLRDLLRRRRDANA